MNAFKPGDEWNGRPPLLGRLLMALLGAVRAVPGRELDRYRAEEILLSNINHLMLDYFKFISNYLPGFWRAPLVLQQPSVEELLHGELVAADAVGDGRRAEVDHRGAAAAAARRRPAAIGALRVHS